MFSSDDQRQRYYSQFCNKVILDPKYLHLEFFDEETFDCYQVFQNYGLIDFMSLKLSYFPELVKVFYNNLKIQDGILYSEVQNILVVIDQSLFFSLTQFAPFDLFLYTVVGEWAALSSPFEIPFTLSCDDYFYA